MSGSGQKRAQQQQHQKHPYLSGNFAPIQKTSSLTPCEYTGTIPHELAGGQYVRNGGNPVSHEDLGRDAHWFDGDGMLSGVLFRRSVDRARQIQPEFVNQYILTDLYLSRKTTSVPSAIMPSITTLVNPISTLLTITLSILRTLFLVLLSHLPGSQQAIKRISVANTSILYHDGRALATCESGPPIRIQLPSLDTVGWYDGRLAEGEHAHPEPSDEESPFGGAGLMSFMKEWTTGHPKVDPITHEMVLHHNTFFPPYVHYSVIPGDGPAKKGQFRLTNAPVSGVSGAKMMHDFGVSRGHTLIMDLPLTLDPLNLLRNGQVVSYDPSQPSRFGIFPRRDPSNVQWFTTASCCIFHVANMWDSSSRAEETDSVNLLACRMTSATLVYSAGNIGPTQSGDGSHRKPIASPNQDQKGWHDSKEICRYEKGPELEYPESCASAAADEEDQCRLYYYEFDLSSKVENRILHQWALSVIPLEFPSVHPGRAMQSARYVYGCSTSLSSFGAALGRAVKIDVLAKVDCKTLIEKGKKMGLPPVIGCVDTRTVSQILGDGDSELGGNGKDPIQLFRLPQNYFAQEPRFVPRSDAPTEDAGFLLFYVFDESQLLPSGDCAPSAVSELWILDAENMRDVVAKVKLPQRVPYGLHGTWFSETDIERQIAVDRLRSLQEMTRKKEECLNQASRAKRWWMQARDWMERAAG